MSKRLGLLIGNSVYRDNTLARLAAPDVDVGDFADVLLDPEVGGFDDVNVIVNVSAAIARRAISDFFSSKDREDLLLLYFSCHGVLDENGRLYLAFKDTERQLLRATSISAAYITDEMNASRSQRQVLILDCCHSGAFARGSKGATGASVGTASAFEGTGFGRVVLTATDATQYAWEDDQVSGQAINSLFTRYLVQGLQSGEADTNKDGRITVDELFDYIYPLVVKRTPKQTPGKWSYKEQGEIVIASNAKHPIINKTARQNIEFDDDLEQRLARLYTRGLSAFWVEDWNKAEKAFQAITEIQPDYQDTALKLSEVKRQKKLSDLYQQAVAASDDKDWDAAITALQTLAEETGSDSAVEGYKDVDSRLAEARKQKSLADLYSQAQQLYQAGQWQAVVNVFAKITTIEKDYPDPDNLLAQTKLELETENRKKELESHYYQALRAMEAARWQAARDHLLAVQTIEPAYGETERLLVRVDAELVLQSKTMPDRASSQVAAQAEAKPSAVGSRGVEGGFKRIRDFRVSWNFLNPIRRPSSTVNANLYRLPDRSLWYILMIAAGWLLASLIHFWQGQSLIDQGLTNAVWFIRFFVFGALAGFFFWLVLRQLTPKLTWKWGLIIIAGWTLGTLLLNFPGSNSPGVVEIGLSFAAGGLSGGLAIGWAMHKIMPSLTIRQLGVMVLGCALGFGIGGLITGVSAQNLIYHYDETIGIAAALSLGGMIGGLLGAAVVVSLLSDPNRQVVNWKIILSGVIGFFLGGFIVNLIVTEPDLYNDSIYLYLAISGAIGMAFLGLPSRDPRRILVLSVFGLIGLPLGHWLGISLFSENDVLVMICWGAGIGLMAGLSTRSVPGAIFLTLFGLAAATITFGMVTRFWGYDLTSIIFALESGAAGGILALGWSFLGGDVTR